MRNRYETLIVSRFNQTGRVRLGNLRERGARMVAAEENKRAAIPTQSAVTLSLTNRGALQAEECNASFNIQQLIRDGIIEAGLGIGKSKYWIRFADKDSE